MLENDLVNGHGSTCDCRVKVMQLLLCGPSKSRGKLLSPMQSVHTSQEVCDLLSLAGGMGVYFLTI